MATFDATTFCTVGDVRDTIDGLDVVCQKTNDANFDSYVQNKITLSKNRLLKFDLQKECQKRFPDTIEQWTRFMHDQMDSAVASNARTRIQSRIDEVLPPNSFDATYAYLNTYTFNALFGFQPYATVQDPLVYFNSGVPGSTTLQNVAKRGAICIDTLSSDNQFPYINRGSAAAPNWQVMNARDGIDYILNPDVLINCAVHATLLLMAKDGIFQSNVGYTSNNIYSYTTSTEAMFSDWYDEAKNGRLSDDKKKRISEGDFSLIDWDMDGDGIISNFEKSINVENSTTSAIW